jgi:putative phage-type endonuclease
VSPEFIGRYETGSPEWHQARAGALGGSEIAAALGLSIFESPFSLWHRKAGQIGPVEDNGEMYWGRVHEPQLRTEFAKRHPEFAVYGDVGTWRDAEHEFIVANPDGLLYPAGTLPAGMFPLPSEVWEGKCARSRTGWGEEGSDDVPVYYRAQGLWYCRVFRAARVRFSVLFFGCEYAEFVVEYDEAEAQILIERGAAFVQSLIDNIRPAIDSHEKTYAAVREMSGGIEDFDVELERDLALPYLEAQQAYTAAVAARRLHTARVMDAVGTGRRATWIGEPIARRQRKGDAAPFLVHIPAEPDKKVIA